MIAFSYVERTNPLWQRWLIDLIERFTGRQRLYGMYRDYDRRRNCFEAAIDAMDLRLEIGGHGLSSIPSNGPLVVVAIILFVWSMG